MPSIVAFPIDDTCTIFHFIKISFKLIIKHKDLIHNNEITIFKIKKIILNESTERDTHSSSSSHSHSASLLRSYWQLQNFPRRTKHAWICARVASAASLLLASSQCCSWADIHDTLQYFTFIQLFFLDV